MFSFAIILFSELWPLQIVPTDEERADERDETGWKLVHAVRPNTGFYHHLCCLFL